MVITRCGRQVSLVCVIVLTVIAIAIPSPLVAQATPDDVWWTGDFPTALGATLVKKVQATPASDLDATLPSITFEQWLSLTLVPIVDVVHPETVAWTATWCRNLESARPRLGPDLCVEGTARVSAERTLQIVIAVAKADRIATTSQPQWRPTGPVLRDLYVERLKGSESVDSLEVPTLSALPRLINTPFDQWPAVAFDTKVSWTPTLPSPGDTVRFSVSVRNTSARAVDRIRIVVAIGRMTAEEVRQEWYPRIAAGETVRLEGSVPLPDGVGMAIVYLEPFQERPKKIRQSASAAATTIVPIGYPNGYSLPPNEQRKVR